MQEQINETTHQGLFPLTRVAGAKMFQGQSQRVFKPRGLMLWDVGTSQIEIILIGTDAQLLCSWGPIPARWFAMQDSFAAVAKAVADGKEPPGWGSWAPVLPGMLVRVNFDQLLPDQAQALMWGEYC